MSDKEEIKNEHKPYIRSESELEAEKDVYKCYTEGTSILQKSYAQFNNRTIFDAIDDWEKRWNGWIPAMDPLINTNSTIFLNFTRNAIISYISKVSSNQIKTKVAAVNKKSGLMDKQLSRVADDLIQYSSDEENGDARSAEANLERTIKGTAIVYEGYARRTATQKIPDGFDTETGKGKFKEEKRILFDNCFQKLVKVNHFMIKNPYLPAWRLQEQPWVLWEEITTYDEAQADFGKYKNWDKVVKGSQATPEAQTTWYENSLITDLKADQVQILRLYKHKKNIHRIMINGVIVYDGPIPFKDGRYPFAAYIFEPFGNDFFWGAGFPNKIMGEQDSLNTQINLMTDKQYNSLLPFGLSSDLDDLIEDDVLEANKIRKVGDINKWRWETLPGVESGELGFFQTTLQLANQNSGDVQGTGNAGTSRGGKVTARQVLLKQQEAMQRMEFSMGYMEDGERDRTILRLNHILQFYAIPKIEKITGKNGKEIEQMLYRDVSLRGAKLSNDKEGTRLIDLVNSDSLATPDKQQEIADNLSVLEAMGEVGGIPTEALAVNVDTFYDYNYSIQVIKNSSFTRNQALDQAMKHEFADWLISLIPMGLHIDVQKLADWVGESYDAEVEDFIQQTTPQQMQQPGLPGQPQGQLPPGSPTPRMQGMQQSTQAQPALSQIMS